MAVRIDWARSLVMTAVLIVILYALGYFIEDQNTYCIAAIVIFVVIFLIGNLAFRKR